jgi:hypothetical protein
MSDKFLSLDEIKTTVEWARASADVRQTFIKWVELDHDPVAVVKALRHPKNEKAARVTAARLFSIPTMRELMAVHLGESALSRFKEDVRRVLSSGKISHTKLQALKLLAKVNGFDASALELPEPEGNVIGKKDSVLNGRKIRTVVVDLGEASE